MPTPSGSETQKKPRQNRVKDIWLRRAVFIKGSVYFRVVSSGYYFRIEIVLFLVLF